MSHTPTPESVRPAITQYGDILLIEQLGGKDAPNGGRIVVSPERAFEACNTLKEKEAALVVAAKAIDGLRNAALAQALTVTRLKERRDALLEAAEALLDAVKHRSATVTEYEALRKAIVLCKGDAK